MASQTARSRQGGQVPGRQGGQVPDRRRRHHWGRWLLGGLAGLIMLVVAVAGLAITLAPSPAPLALPAAGVSAPAGPLAGTWTVAAGSVAGFRVRESAAGMGNDTVGRTRAITGTVVIAGGRVTAADLRIGLAALRVNGKVQPQFVTSLGVRSYPDATFTLTRPVALPASFSSGRPFRSAAAGRLTLHGTTRPVTVALSARRDGRTLAAVATIGVPFSRWHITGPRGYGFLGSLASNGTAEMLLILDRR